MRDERVKFFAFGFVGELRFGLEVIGRMRTESLGLGERAKGEIAHLLEQVESIWCTWVGCLVRMNDWEENTYGRLDIQVNYKAPGYSKVMEKGEGKCYMRRAEPNFLTKSYINDAVRSVPNRDEGLLLSKNSDYRASNAFQHR